MEIQFFIPLEKIPTATAQEKRIAVKNGKPVVYMDNRLKAVKQLYLAQLMGMQPPQPLAGPIRLHIRWCFATNKPSLYGAPKVTKPDTDNMIKLFKDCMTEVGFWKDDAQVFREINEKMWGPICGIWVNVIEVKEGRNE